MRRTSQRRSFPPRTLESNLAAHLYQQKGNYEAAKAQADVLIKRRFYIDRGAAAAMENRGIVAHSDEKSKQLTIWDTTQAPIPIRNGTAARLGLSDSQVRVIAPFIGGGFGPKIMMFYPEEMLLPWASKKLCRPIKWIEDRRENFYATTSERQQVHDVEMAFSKNGRILGLKDDFLHDTGAFDPYGYFYNLSDPHRQLTPKPISRKAGRRVWLFDPLGAHEHDGNHRSHRVEFTAKLV